VLKSRKGSSEIKSAFPSGHATSLLIKTIVAVRLSIIADKMNVLKTKLECY